MLATISLTLGEHCKLPSNKIFNVIQLSIFLLNHMHSLRENDKTQSFLRQQASSFPNLKMKHIHIVIASSPVVCDIAVQYSHTLECHLPCLRITRTADFSVRSLGGNLGTRFQLCLTSRVDDPTNSRPTRVSSRNIVQDGFTR